jgi:hypothetical protein
LEKLITAKTQTVGTKNELETIAAWSFRICFGVFSQYCSQLYRLWLCDIDSAGQQAWVCCPLALALWNKANKEISARRFDAVSTTLILIERLTRFMRLGTYRIFVELYTLGLEYSCEEPENQ